MSIIAKQHIQLPKDVQVTLNEANLVIVVGKNGQLQFKHSDLIDVVLEEKKLRIHTKKNMKGSSMFAGTTWAILNNMIIGVSEGFEKKLILEGVGYRAEIKGDILILNLGYSHPINFKIPKDIKITLENPTKIIVFAIDKQRVGQIAANIRSYRKPEPYKGKGIRYDGEIIKRKEAKKK